MFHGSFRLNNLARETINQVDSGEKSLIPILKRHRCITNKMGDSHMLEKGVKFLILVSPIGLHCKDFLIK
jgi:hypothetical protein